ncbi:MAG: extracellular solute-binding protein [Firmicutes bacterium]|jgi:multiple sugar transport system substrate-binding protein|nr:extracellular solute-binding protein [Bacillota bacterium]
MLKRRTMLILVVVLTGVLAFGAMAAAAESVTLRFLMHTYKPWNDLLAKQAREFEKLHPNVKIVITTVEHADLNMKLMTSLAAGTAPEILGVYGPWMVDLVENGWIDPAPDFVVEDIRENTVPVAGQSAEYDGKVYGYIQHIGIQAPVINARMYREAGLDIPTTYDELLEVNKVLDKYDNRGRLTQAGTTLSVSKDGSWNVIHWSTILKAFGGELVTPDGKQAAFNTPEGLEATKVYQQLTHANFIEDAFTLEKAAMEWQGPWTKAFYLQNNPRLEFQAIAPLRGPARQVMAMYAWFWTVNANAAPAQKEWAWKFLQYISNDDNYLDMAMDVGFISFRKAHYDDPRYASDEWIKAFGEALEVADIYYAKVSGWEKVDVAIGQELERLTVGELTAEEFLEIAEKRVNEILAEIN